MVRTRQLPLLGALLVLAACSSGGDETDNRCFDIAQVPAWAIHITSAFGDTGTRDSMNMRLHVAMDVSDTTGAVVKQAHGVSWFGKSTTGTITRRDTLINNTSHDTIIGVSHAPSGIGSAGGLATLYVSTNLETCVASIGGVVQAPESTFVNGVFNKVDTLNVGYAFAPGFTIDAGSPAAGWTLAPLKVKSVTPNASFTASPDYRAGGFVTSYTTGTATVTELDSATVGWSATPVATPANAGPVPAITIENGRIISLPRP